MMRIASFSGIDALRILIVCSCAMAMVLADKTAIFQA